MIIESVSLANLRNHVRFTCHFSPDITLLYGKNGAGKTGVLEAVHIALRGTSFRGSDREIVASDKAMYGIDVVTDVDRRKITYARQTRKKEITVNAVSSQRMLAKNRYPVVVFTPDDLRLLEGSPSRRRAYLDTMISQTSPSHMTTVRRYERALLQRNNLLKDTLATTDDIFPWDVLVAEYGSKIIEARLAMIGMINAQLREAYGAIAGAPEHVAVRYSHHEEHSPHHLLTQLKHSFAHDRRFGYTTIGPHRHDMIMYFRERLAAEVASRGENRTLVLALKQIETSIIESEAKSPIVLLDDVYGELDDVRRRQLSHIFTGQQTIITSAQPVDELDGVVVRLP